MNGDIDAQPSTRAFKRLANSVARDKRLGPAELVLLAWRSTFVGNYAMNEKTILRKPLVKPGTGLGKNAIRDGIAAICGAGYIKRTQKAPEAHSKFAKGVTEQLTLPPCGESGRAGQIVLRKWFDGRLSLKAMAAFLFLRAGTGRGKRMFARELAARFRWSRPTAAKVIRELTARGLLAQHKRRSKGRMAGTLYGALPSRNCWGNGASATVKKPGIGLPGTGILGDILTSRPSNSPPTEEPLPHTMGEPIVMYASHGEAAPLNGRDEGNEGVDVPTLAQLAFGCSNLLGWLSDDEHDDMLRRSRRARGPRHRGGLR